MAEIKGIQIPDSNSDSNNWVTYHMNLKKVYGGHNANTIWLKTWAEQKNTSASDEPNFIEYFKKQNIDVSSSYDKLAASYKSIGDDVFGFVGSAGTALKYGIPIVFGLILIGAGFFLYKQMKSTERLANKIDVNKVLGAAL